MGLERDALPEKVLELLEKLGKVVGGGKEEGNRVDKSVVPLASRASDEAACVE